MSDFNTFDDAMAHMVRQGREDASICNRPYYSQMSEAKIVVRHIRNHPNNMSLSDEERALDDAYMAAWNAENRRWGNGR